MSREVSGGFNNIYFYKNFEEGRFRILERDLSDCLLDFK